MMRGLLLVFRLSTICSLLLFSPLVLLAGNIDPDNDGAKFAWGENVGWVNFSSPSATSRVKTSWRPQSNQQLCDADADGDVDINDIRAIAAARNTPAVPGDARDVDGDGVITLNDARQCVLQCTNPRCAP